MKRWVGKFVGEWWGAQGLPTFQTRGSRGSDGERGQARLGQANVPHDGCLAPSASPRLLGKLRSRRLKVRQRQLLRQLGGQPIDPQKNDQFTLQVVHPAAAPSTRRLVCDLREDCHQMFTLLYMFDRGAESEDLVG